MVWHVIYEDRDSRVKSRAARSRALAIHMACELLKDSYDVRRAIGPDGLVIDRAELDGHYDEGRFPGLVKGRISSFVEYREARRTTTTVIPFSRTSFVRNGEIVLRSPPIRSYRCPPGSGSGRQETAKG